MGKVNHSFFLLRLSIDILIVEMSMMGELQFFLDLQIRQSKKELSCIKPSTPRKL
jgi:hypothetical protein